MDNIVGKIDLLLDMSKYSEAAKLAKEAIRREPEWFSGYLQLARAYLVLGDLEKALGAAREGIKRDPSNAWGHRLVSVVQMRRGKPLAALQAIEESLRHGPFEPAGHAQRGLVLNALGRHVEALAAAETGLQFDATDAACLGERGWALMQSGRLHEAMACARAAREQHPLDGRFWNLLGLIYRDYGHQAGLAAKGEHFEQANAHIREAVRLDPVEQSFRENLQHNAMSAGMTAGIVWMVVAGAVTVPAIIVVATQPDRPIYIVLFFLWVGWFMVLVGFVLWDDKPVHATMPRFGMYAPPAMLTHRQRWLGRAFWVAWPVAAVALATTEAIAIWLLEYRR
jgi:tetratricopeptide (TPR) repeat protein